MGALSEGIIGKFVKYHLFYISIIEVRSQN